VNVEITVDAKELAHQFSNYWEEFAEFVDELSMWDGRYTVRGQAEAVVSVGCGQRVATYLRKLADAVDDAERRLLLEDEES